jgi:hypothetical protein
MLALYYRALCGQACSLVPYDDDGGSPWEHADTETTVWLPARAPRDDHADFTVGQWYQVAMTHRAMHQRLGTFQVDPDGDEPLFRRLRPPLISSTAGETAVPALERLAALFGHSVLGVHIFATCEDLRIDAATDRLYPGLAQAARGVRHGALHQRPAPASLFPRAAAIGALVRLSLVAGAAIYRGAGRRPLAGPVASPGRPAVGRPGARPRPWRRGRRPGDPPSAAVARRDAVAAVLPHSGPAAGRPAAQFRRPGFPVNGAPAGAGVQRVHLPGVGCVRRPLPSRLHARSSAPRPGGPVRPPPPSRARGLRPPDRSPDAQPRAGALRRPGRHPPGRHGRRPRPRWLRRCV